MTEFALISRVLTDDEMQAVESYGYSLFVNNNEPFFQIDKIKQFNEALLQQFRLRHVANQSRAGAS